MPAPTTYPTRPRPTDTQPDTAVVEPVAALERTDDLTGFVADAGPAAWRADARCADGGPALTRLFFSEELQDIAAAKRICAECPVLADCLEGAIERREPWGVWGGQLFLNGKALAGKRRRGRPPKHPRLEDQLPDVPVPAHLVDRLEIRTA